MGKKEYMAFMIFLITLNLFLWPFIIFTYLNQNETAIDPNDDRNLTKKPQQQTTSKITSQQDNTNQKKDSYQIPNTIEGQKAWLKKVLGQDFTFNPEATYDTKNWSGERILALRMAEDIWRFENERERSD